jgi:hypothetical protein
MLASPIEIRRRHAAARLAIADLPSPPEADTARAARLIAETGETVALVPPPCGGCGKTR